MQSMIEFSYHCHALGVNLFIVCIQWMHVCSLFAYNIVWCFTMFVAALAGYTDNQLSRGTGYIDLTRGSQIDFDDIRAVVVCRGGEWRR